MSGEITILRASADHLEEVVPLFDAYRRFYGQDSDTERARRYLAERLHSGESTIFLARQGSTAAGFVQLYPSFSSIAMRRTWVLNDLFVSEASRRSGVASALMREAERFARGTNAVRVVLATAIDNRRAQALYEKLGWVRDDAFLHYEYEL